MVNESSGNLLEAKTEALVNAVNCVGVMGKGIALAFRRKFPDDYFQDYKRACENGELKIGKVHVYRLNREINPRYIINFPTKNHWRGKSRIEDIESGLQSLTAEIKNNQIKSVAIPALGCGLGGLDWEDIRHLIKETFESLPETKVLLFAPPEEVISSSQV